MLLNFVSRKVLTHHVLVAHEERRIYQQKVEGYKREGHVIVYLDESGFAHDIPRTHGYAPVGERAHGVKDWHAGGRTYVIGALIKGVLLTVGLFTAHINTDIFYAWVTQSFCPSPCPLA
ncbi:DDE superfamily endonuclease [Nitrosomonas communis]|uniref:DDE superfamily endonuclease n=2 Tax=Nitrosomonas communis TaxID=44574 RepID=A0A1H2ZYB4_9PROT|nr:DDE superfamily endonuclease [Nitrosomonas communis]